MSNFTSRAVIRIQSDEDYYYEIGEDADGLGSVEIRYYEKEKDGEYTRQKRMSFDADCIPNIIHGLQTICNELPKK